jgi:polyribonucleotide nucleotidyltransferase
MEEAMNAVMAIVDPPKAEIGKVYMGRVVNITKFGAFVNILPGRDGLVHISKLGGGKRINSVEDVLELGQEIEVVVEEIDDRGKVSLTPAGDAPAAKSDSAPAKASSPAPASSSGDAPKSAGAPTETVETVSFEETFDAELASELGDLGPASERRNDDRGDRGGRRRHR